ncbi:Longin-like domain superfamily [Sesbania bispinosa]|nr:Longin-like domain superfamily [Sesbania bispinosa]
MLIFLSHTSRVRFVLHYACIPRSTTILAQHHNGSKLTQTPPKHSLFSHTVNNRTYTFLIDPPFVFFAIFDSHLLKSQTLSFLNHIRSSFRETLDASKHFAPFSLQSQFDSVFREALNFDSQSSDSVRSSTTLPLLEKQPDEGLKKKKSLVDANGTTMMMDGKDAVVVAMLDVSNNVVSVSVAKVVGNDRQKAKHIWKKHVWVGVEKVNFVAVM